MNLVIPVRFIKGAANIAAPLLFSNCLSSAFDFPHFKYFIIRCGYFLFSAHCSILTLFFNICRIIKIITNLSGK